MSPYEISPSLVDYEGERAMAYGDAIEERATELEHDEAEVRAEVEMVDMYIEVADVLTPLVQMYWSGADLSLLPPRAVIAVQLIASSVADSLRRKAQAEIDRHGYRRAA